MELNLHRGSDCTVKRDYHDEGEPVMPGFPPSHAFHVTHLAIVDDAGITATIRLFSPQRLAITTEGGDDGSTTSMEAQAVAEGETPRGT